MPRFKTWLAVMLIALVLSVSAFSAEPDLIGHWNFDENGDIAKDVTGNGNDGQINGSNNRVAGVSGQALEFDKGKQTFVEVIDNQTLDIIDAITIEAWIQPKSIYIGNDWKQRNCVLGKATAYYLDINEQGNLASFLYGVQPQEWLVGQTDMRDFVGQWVHVAAVFDGKEHALYINGDKDAGVAKQGKIQSVDRALEIGWVDNERYFDGLIDEVKLWGRALDEDELKATATLPVEPMGKLSVAWGAVKSGR